MKTALKLALALVSCLSVSLPILGARYSIEHVAKLVRVADPQISPDGKSIVAVVSRPNYDDNRYDAELVLIDVAAHKQRVLTNDRRGVSFPRWSPSGDRLAFLATVGANAQVFVM